MLKESQEKVNRDFDDRIRELENATEKLENTMIKEQSNIIASKQEIEKSQGMLQQLKQDFNIFRVDTNNRMSSNKEELQEQIYSTDRYVGEVQSGLNREVNDVRKSGFDMLKQTEKELVDRFSDQYTEVKNYMTSNVE